MLEMLKERKAQLEARGEKGFTLMEMLIVIAIIAILIAIAIPIFTTQLNRANAATDLANIRSGYAQVQSDILLNDVDDETYTLNKDATVAKSGETPDAYETKGVSTDAGSADDIKIGGVTPTWGSGETVTYTVVDGALTAISAS